MKFTIRLSNGFIDTDEDIFYLYRSTSDVLERIFPQLTSIEVSNTKIYGLKFIKLLHKDQVDATYLIHDKNVEFCQSALIGMFGEIPDRIYYQVKN